MNFLWCTRVCVCLLPTTFAKVQSTLYIHLIMFINTEEGASFSHTGKQVPFFVLLHVKRYRSELASPAGLLFNYTGVGRQVLTL